MTPIRKPIIALIGFLIGVILAFVGSLELGRFGAAAYIADLVGLGMVREVGALMTAIVVAGRTGAAFAAELATMRVTQELDALAVVDLPPVELLVVPRVVALATMVPLLAAYASVLGIIGGAAIGIFVLGVPPRDYLDHTIAIIGAKDVIGGLVKALSYGVVIAVGGCAAGLRADAGAAAVGEAATRAVVTGIVFTTLVCGGYAVLFARLGL
jgi:phospholipid/cholesterol/gamma-HCH transport system permease protein